MSAPGVLVKGIRSQIDVAYESPMAIVNRHLADIETVFLLPDPSHAMVSSSLVRQVASLGGDVDTVRSACWWQTSSTPVDAGSESSSGRRSARPQVQPSSMEPCALE